MSSKDLPDSSPHPMPWRAIDAYLAGEATADEQAVVRAWMAANANNAAIVDAMRAALEPSGAQAMDVDAAWAAVAERAGIGGSRQPGHATAPATARVLPLRVRPRFLREAAIAAGLVLAASIGGGIWWARSAKVELLATSGQRITRALGDGSSVTLNSGSRLRFARFGNDRRDVELEGEALFHVAHDAARPFHVRAGGAVVTDLGTRFVVRAYPELGQVMVAVTEGRVSLKGTPGGATSDSLLLDAGMVGRRESDGSLSMQPTVKAADMAAWVDRTLVFDATPLAEVAAQLQRRYGVVIRLADPALASRRVTATVRDETLTQALDAISLALGLRYERAGDVVTVHGAR